MAEAGRQVQAPRADFERQRRVRRDQQSEAPAAAKCCHPVRQLAPVRGLVVAENNRAISRQPGNGFKYLRRSIRIGHIDQITAVAARRQAWFEFTVTE